MRHYQLLSITILIVMMMSLVAAYTPQPQNKDFDLIVSSNNATQCNLTYIQYVNLPKKIMNINLTKSGHDFFTTIKAGNYTTLGNVCHGVTCTDGTTIEVGSICREVTPSGFTDTLGFYFILLTVVTLVIILGFSIKEEWFVVIGGLALMMLGLYSINFGIAGQRDMFMTWGVGIFEIAIGAILSIGAAWQKIE